MAESDSLKCPACGSVRSKYVTEAESRAIGRLPYHTCLDCGTHYHAPWAVSDIPGTSGLLASVFIILLGVVALSSAFEEANSFGMNRLNAIVLGVALCCVGIGGFIAMMLGITVWRQPVRVEIVVPEDDGKRTPAIERWLARSESKSLGLRVLRICGGWILSAVGAAIAIGAIVVFRGAGGTAAHQGNLVEMTLAFTGGVILSLVGPLLHRFGKSLTVPRAAEILRSDKRRPVLILRSFADDNWTLIKGSTVERKLNPLTSHHTLEEEICDVFRVLGPVVALGRPGEAVAPPGAARMWLEHDEWKDIVFDLLHWAQRVVLVLGDAKVADGLTWEIETVFAKCPPHKLIVVAPPKLDEGDLRRRWDKARAVCGSRLPPFSPGASLIAFKKDWSANVICLRNSEGALIEERYNFVRSSLEAARDWIAQSDGCFETIEYPAATPTPPGEQQVSNQTCADESSVEPTRPALVIMRCPHCATRVIPMRNGCCPSCRRAIDRSMATSDT